MAASSKRQPKPASPGAERALLLGALGIGLLLRLAYLAQIRENPFFDAPIIDGAEYLAWARRILAGELLWTQVPIHSPGYPYLLAGLLALSGKSLVFVIFIQLGFGVAGAFLLHRIAGRFFSASTALVAAFLGATYLNCLYFEGLLLAEALGLLLSLALLERLAALPRSPAPPTLVVPGLLLGLSVATHPRTAVLLPALAVWVYLRAFRFGREERAARSDRLVASLAFAAGALVVIAPILVRNASLGGGAVMQRNMGKNFYIGMGPTADGTANIPPGTPWDRLRRQAWEAGARTAGEETRYYVGEALGFAARNPGAALGLLARKTLMFITGIHVDASQDHRFFRTNASVLRLPLPAAAVVIPLGLLGLVRYRKRAPLLVLYLGASFVATVAFAYSTRYALGAHPAFLVFAAAALVRLAGAAQARRIDSTDVALLALFLLVANLDPFGLRSRQLLNIGGYIARNVSERGQIEEGLALHAQAAQQYPNDPDIRNTWGTLFDRIGRREEAQEQYEAALAAAPDHFEARFNLASQAYERGDSPAAIAGYRAAAEAAPWRADPHLNLGAVYADLDSLDAAVTEFETALALAPEFWEASMNLAMLETRRGNPQRAAAIYQRLLADTPDPDVAVRLGRTLTAAEDYLGAQEAFRRALQLDPRHVEAMYELGMNVAGFQRFEEAIAHWERLLEIAPDHPTAAVAIEQARARIAARDVGGEETSEAGETPAPPR